MPPGPLGSCPGEEGVLRAGGRVFRYYGCGLLTALKGRQGPQPYRYTPSRGSAATRAEDEGITDEPLFDKAFHQDERSEDFYPAECNEDVYPTECNEGVAVHPAEHSEDVYPTECNEGVYPEERSEDLAD